MNIRRLGRHEIDDIRGIDRSELIEEVYYFERGRLVPKREHWDVKGWEPAVIDRHVEGLKALHGRKGTLLGAFDGDRLIGVVALETGFIGVEKDTLPVPFLHVGRAHRNTGIGGKLLALVEESARALGAGKLYISASPSKASIDFYLGRGCRPTKDVDPELFALEPDDIHLELPL